VIVLIKIDFPAPVTPMTAIATSDDVAPEEVPHLAGFGVVRRFCNLETMMTMMQLESLYKIGSYCAISTSLIKSFRILASDEV
jgi:hypothetical protein